MTDWTEACIAEGWKVGKRSVRVPTPADTETVTVDRDGERLHFRVQVDPDPDTSSALDLLRQNRSMNFAWWRLRENGAYAFSSCSSSAPPSELIMRIGETARLAHRYRRK